MSEIEQVRQMSACMRIALVQTLVLCTVHRLGQHPYLMRCLLASEQVGGKPMKPLWVYTAPTLAIIGIVMSISGVVFLFAARIEISLNVIYTLLGFLISGLGAVVYYLSEILKELQKRSDEE